MFLPPQGRVSHRVWGTYLLLTYNRLICKYKVCVEWLYDLR